MIKARKFKFPLTVCVLFMLSAMAGGNGPLAPELPLLDQAKSMGEYPVLKQLQELTFELQMLELIVKNRRDAGVETKISKSIDQIHEKSSEIGNQFKSMRQTQLDEVFKLIFLAKRYSKIVGVENYEWDRAFTDLKEGKIQEGIVCVHVKKAGAPDISEPLSVLSLEPVRVGKQVVWKIMLPEWDRMNFWSRAQWALRKQGRTSSAKALSTSSLKKRLEEANVIHKKAMELAESFYKESHKNLYDSFEEQRYGIMSRMNMAKKALVDLSNKNSAMGTPEEYAALYNQLLDNLYSYGMDISFNGDQRDFKIKGILFGDSPEAAKEVVARLKFNPSQASFNSPSS